MGTKKVAGPGDVIIEFKSVMQRAAISDYKSVDRYMISKTEKCTVVVVPDVELWPFILEDQELKEHMKPLDLNDPADAELGSITKYAADIDLDGWVEPNLEDLFAGKPLKMTIDGFSYELSYSKDMLPLKLRKAEQNQIAYRVYLGQNPSVAIKKRFVVKNLDQYGFTMIRVFQII